MKKTVHYNNSVPAMIALGVGALVKPCDHPDSSNVTNKNYVFTSPVLEYHGNGVFETMNTIYVPVEIN